MGEDRQRDDGMLYFKSFDDLLHTVFYPSPHEIVPLQNYEDSFGKRKTLLCHDMMGGYLPCDTYGVF